MRRGYRGRTRRTGRTRSTRTVAEHIADVRLPDLWQPSRPAQPHRTISHTWAAHGVDGIPTQFSGSGQWKVGYVSYQGYRAWAQSVPNVVQAIRIRGRREDWPGGLGRKSSGGGVRMAGLHSSLRQPPRDMRDSKSPQIACRTESPGKALAAPLMPIALVGCAPAAPSRRLRKTITR